VLDKEGNALISKYYNAPELTDENKRAFETKLHKKASKLAKPTAFESKKAS